MPAGGAFARRFSAMVRDVALLAAPLLLGGAAVLPDLYRVWLDARWLPGVLPAQLTLLGGLAFTLVYCFDAAFLAARLPAMFRRTSTLQAVTTAVTALAAAPFGLDAVCAALLLRGWVLLLPYVAILRRRCGIGFGATFAPPLRPLLGAALMAAALSLPWWRMPAADPRLLFAGLIGAGALGYLLFCWAVAREDLRAVLGGILARRT
jgi:O-antigen/teichoic acid export membrane protein